MRKLIAKILTRQAVRYIQRYSPKIVAITGSVGKTSTTQAIATILGEGMSVRSTIANYNTDIGVPCSIFAQDIPGSLKNPFAWLRMFRANEKMIRHDDQIDVLVLELGTDAIGEIASFTWLNPDIAVVTAIAPEHMEYFGTIEAVAKEELSVAEYSKKTFINARMVDAEYLETTRSTEIVRYDRGQLSEYDIAGSALQVVGQHSIDAIVAGLAVGTDFGLSPEQLRSGAASIKPRPGRMQRLEGIRGSTLIDDTYNSSPVAVYAALDYLYDVKAPQRIVLLGNMNELGESSEDEHARIGEYCDPTKLDLVVTLGPDANEFTAPAALRKGCIVEQVSTPYAAAKVIKKHMKDGAHIVLKGSQNRVFAEEAVVPLLKNPADVSKLVRQSDFWKAKKAQNFGERAS